MKVKFFICILSLGALLTGNGMLYAQEKSSVQIKIFDEELKPLAGLEISINGEPFIRINERGTAFMDIEESKLPPQTVKIRNEALEAASWNYSRGVLEIIVRKKNYKMAQLGVYDAKGRPIAGAAVTFAGKQKISAATNANGLAAIPLALDDKIRTKNQFSIEGYTIVNLIASDKENKLIVKPLKTPAVAAQPDKAGEVILDETYFKNFDLRNLDSIQSLTLFYAVFKNYEIDDLPDSIRRKVDRKFNELIGRLEDSLKHAPRTFIGKISDSSVVNDDIKNLLAQAVAEGRTLDEMHTSYNEKVLVIQGKLQAGIENLNPAAREDLMKDIELLEQILALNEDKFYKNQTGYRSVLNSLREKLFNVEDLQQRLSLSEAQRVEEQRLFQKRIVTIFAIAVTFALLLILLGYFSSKLKKQKKELVRANAEVKRINENLENLVYERTKLLEHAHREMDVFLYRASHDLRGPICSIMGLYNIAKHTMHQESMELFEKTFQTANGMDRMLKKLQEVSEINHPGNYTMIFLKQKIDKIRQDFDGQIAVHNITFKVDCADDLSFHSYENLIHILLVNLLDNAIFFSSLNKQNRPEVGVTAVRENGHVRLTIYDNGVGIDDSIRNHLWDMFYIGNEHSRGNGLGLYIVNKTIQVLNGTILLESKKHVFTRFVVTLPVEQESVRAGSLHEAIASPNKALLN